MRCAASHSPTALKVGGLPPSVPSNPSCHSAARWRRAFRSEPQLTARNAELVNKNIIMSLLQMSMNRHVHLGSACYFKCLSDEMFPQDPGTEP